MEELYDKSLSIKPKLEKHKVDDTVTVDKNHSNDIQRSEEEDKQLQSTTNAVFWQITGQTILDLGSATAQIRGH